MSASGAAPEVDANPPGRLTPGLFLFGVALLPWATVPPFPFLHPHAQWSDVLFLLTFISWLPGRLRRSGIDGLDLAVLGYAAWASASFVHAWGGEGPSPAHLLGVLELGALALMARDLCAGAEFRRGLFAVAAASSLLVCSAAVCGLALAAMGVETVFVGGFGDLLPGAYRRAQAGLAHPNMLASVCLFLWAGVAQDDSALGSRWRRLCLAALILTVGLTFSRSAMSFAVALLAHRARSRFAFGAVVAAAVATAVLVGLLTFWNVEVSPLRPWAASLSREDSPRLQAATTALVTAAAHPVFGIGPGRSPGLANGFPFDAHLTPLNVAATVGLPGLVLFASIMVVAWRTGARARTPWCALLAIGIDALATDVEEFRHVWILLGFAATRPSSGS